MPEALQLATCCTPRRSPQTAPPEPRPTSYPIPPDPRPTMVSLPGGPFLMGSDSPEIFPQDGESPVRQVTLAPFHIDPTPVTNAAFAAFIAATGYRTEAENFGWSFVFHAHVSASLVEDTVAAAPWWCRVAGASWQAPEGPESSVATRPDHPVVHVSHNDALAFAAWSGKRLPTEAQWEYAARGGLTQNTYPWGNKLRPNGRHMCNIWQGTFPTHDTAEDGFSNTCPVRAFPPNAFGLFSLAGNTWEWCADWFSPTAHAIQGLAETQNPQGPSQGIARVTRGGSFLCHQSYCNRYRVSARTSNTPDSSTSHIGFRCAL